MSWFNKKVNKMFKNWTLQSFLFIFFQFHHHVIFLNREIDNPRWETAARSLPLSPREVQWSVPIRDHLEVPLRSAVGWLYLPWNGKLFVDMEDVWEKRWRALLGGGGRSRASQVCQVFTWCIKRKMWDVITLVQENVVSQNSFQWLLLQIVISRIKNTQNLLCFQDLENLINTEPIP